MKSCWRWAGVTHGSTTRSLREIRAGELTVLQNVSGSSSSELVESRTAAGAALRRLNVQPLVPGRSRGRNSEAGRAD